MTLSTLCIARSSLRRTTGLELAGARSDLSHCAVARSHSRLFVRLLLDRTIKGSYFTHITRATPSNSSLKPTAGPFSAAAEQYLHVGTAAANRSRRMHSLVAAAAAPTRSRRGLARGGLAICRWTDGGPKESPDSKVL